MSEGPRNATPDDLRSLGAPDSDRVVDGAPPRGPEVAISTEILPGSADRISKERISALSAKLAARYELTEQVGTGPESVVYRAVDVGTREVVAIKIVDLPEDAMVAGALAAEARLGAGVEHPLVGRIVGFECDTDDAYFISRFIEGENLNSRVRRGGPLPVELARRVGQDLCEAIAAIHELCLLHRNVKSSNVILRSDDSAVLTDLGVGRPTGAPGRLSLPSAPAYTAPEVFEGFASQTSDVFGVGACLYEALTGRPPPMGYVKTPDGLGPDPREHRADAPDDLSQAIRECLARDPQKRPASAAALATRLGRPLAVTGDSAARPSMTRTVLLVLLMIGAVGGSAAILLWRYASWYPELVDRILGPYE